jgi:hypothetical protein
MQFVPRRLQIEESNTRRRDVLAFHHREFVALAKAEFSRTPSHHSYFSLVRRFSDVQPNRLHARFL